MEDDDYDGARPLSNADFRRMLDTPRPGRKQEQGEKKKRPKPGKPKPKSDEEKGAEEPGYRDRADERRKGITADFDAIPEDLANIIQGGQSGLNKLSYEESKFLGGDIAHTHLVKGLDFALLQKVRAEVETKKGEGDESEEEDERAAPAQQRQEVKFVTSMGRAVHAFFFDPKQRRSRADVAEMFLPRRAAFVFELGEPFAPDAPTLLRRSKEDCPKPPETMLGAVDTGVLERMAKIMSYMSLAGGKKKIKKKDKLQLLHGIQAQQAKHPQQQQQQEPRGTGAAPALGGAGPTPAALRRDGGGGGGPAAAPPVPASGAASDEEGDIFADAGTDYVVERKKDKGGEGGAAPGAGRYFDQREDMSDLPPLPTDGAPPPPPAPAGDDMELEDMLPPPPPPDAGAEAGPSRPPADFDYSAAYPSADAYGAYPDTDAAYGPAQPVQQPPLPPGPGLLTAEEKRSGSVFTRDAAALKRQPAAAGDDEDAYAECYPSYYTYAGTVVDSDDEGGPGATAAAKAPGLARSDFGTDEDYKEYLEANPGKAAAAAAGSKGGKGETRRAKREASKRDNKQAQKLNTQLDKIQRIMEDKGLDHTSAFIRSSDKGGGDKGGAGGGGKGGGDSLAEPSMPTKKRRI